MTTALEFSQHPRSSTTPAQRRAIYRFIKRHGSRARHWARHCDYRRTHSTFMGNAVTPRRHPLPTLLGEGCSRAVFAISSTLVVKILYWIDSSQNANEWQLWQQWGARSPLLNPAIAISSDGLFLFARRASRPKGNWQQFDSPAWQPLREATRTLSDKVYRNAYDRNGTRIHPPVEDLHASNVAFLRGRPVIVDYGITDAG